MMKHIALLTLWLAALSQTLPGQTPWSLDKCIEYGLAHNLQLEKHSISQKQEMDMLTQSKLDFLPDLYSSIDWMSDTKKISTPVFISSATLFDGLRRFYGMKSLQMSVRIAEQNRLTIENEVSISITKSYLEVLLAQEWLEISKMSYQVIEEQFLKQKALYESGKSSYSSLLDIESQRSSERMELTNAENRLSSGYLSLAQLINYPYSDEFSISRFISDKEITPLSLASVDSIYAIARTLPYIKAAELSLQQHRYGKKIAAGGLSPQIGITASYTIGNETGNLGISVRIPLFQRLSTLNDIKRSELEYKKSEIELKQREQELYKEVQMAIKDGISYYNEYMASLDHLQAAQAAFEYSKEKLEIGVITTSDYNYSKNTLFEAHSRSIQAKYKYIFQLKIIDFYRGETL